MMMRLENLSCEETAAVFVSVMDELEMDKHDFDPVYASLAGLLSRAMLRAFCEKHGIELVEVETVESVAKWQVERERANGED